MSKKSSPRWLDRCLLPGPYLALCTTPKEYQQVCKHLKVAKADRPEFLYRDNADAAAHFFSRHKRTTAVVCISARKEHSIPQVYALLVHEAVHIWQDTKEQYGEKRPGDEVEAYAVQALAQRLMEAYARQAKLR